MRANLGTFAKFSVVSTWAIGDFSSLLVRVFTHDVTRWSVVADESVFITAAAASNIRASHSRTFRPDQLSVMATLSDLSVLIAHRITGLSGEVITLTLVVPKLNGPHKPLYGARIPVPEEDVLSDGVLLQIPERVRLVPQIALTGPITSL